MFHLIKEAHDADVVVKYVTLFYRGEMIILSVNEAKEPSGRISQM